MDQYEIVELSSSQAAQVAGGTIESCKSANGTTTCIDSTGKNLITDGNGNTGFDDATTGTCHE